VDIGGSASIGLDDWQQIRSCCVLYTKKLRVGKGNLGRTARASR
jgi:hypothetical protein